MPSSFSPSWPGLALALALAFLPCGTARAQTPARPAGGGGGGGRPAADAAPRSADEMIQQIQSAAVSGRAEGARTISQILMRGVPPQVAAAGLDALGALGRPEGSRAVARYMQHRRPTLRRHAVVAAQAIHTPELVRGLVAALSDPDAEVRADAAVALAEVGSAATVAELFAAFDRSLEVQTGARGERLVVAAARGIGRFGAPDDLHRLLSYLRRAPLEAITGGMRLAMQRREVPNELKIRVVRTIADLATADAREFLNGVVADAGGQESAVVSAAREAAGRITE